MAGFEIETFEPNGLKQDAMQSLIEVVREPFMWYAPDSTEEDIYDRLLGNGASWVDVVFQNGEPCGFSVHYAKDIDGSSVDYRGGTSILPFARGKGIYKELINRSLANGNYDYISTRTQNPRVYETLQQFSPSGVIFPHPSRDIPPHIFEIAEATCESGIVEPDTLAVRGVHGFVRADRSFMTARSKEVQDFFSQNLGRDDGYMVVVEL